MTLHINLSEHRTLADWVEIRRQANEILRMADGVITNYMRKELKIAADRDAAARTDGEV